jgi:hypothetical protein
MERGDLSGLVRELSMSHADGKKNSEHTKKMLHIPAILLQN